MNDLSEAGGPARPGDPSGRRTVSVVIPTRDRAALLREALASVREIEGPDLVLDIIVADNGSNDETPEVAREFGARLVRAVRPGAGAARNAGLRAATGEFVAFLDDDDVWLPGHLRPHLALLDQHPDFAGVVGQVANASPDLTSHGPFWPEDLPRDGDLYRTFLSVYPQIGATVVRRTALGGQGMFDEALLGDQDWDWHLRLALKHRLGFVALPCVLFRQRAGGSSDRLQWRRMAFTYRVLFTNLWRGGPRRLPGPIGLARIYLRIAGLYYSYFAESAAVGARTNSRGATIRALGGALVASPLHTGRDLLRPSSLRRSFAWLL